MQEIRPGAVFRDARPPHGRWRVVKESGGMFQLASVEKPNVTRFHTAEKLLNRLFYHPDEESSCSS